MSGLGTKESWGALRDWLGDRIVRESVTAGQPLVEIGPDDILDVLEYLKEELGFDYLTDITCVDHLKNDAYEHDERFGVVYILFSTERKEWIRLKALLGEEAPEIASATALWPSADWLEREVYDMFGITFTDHPDLTRILMPFDFDSHPLRKDYPLQGLGERDRFEKVTPAFRPEEPDAPEGIYRDSPRKRRG